MSDARRYHQQIAFQQQALELLRSGLPLAKHQWEKVYPGARLAPVVEQLRNAHGFTIEGNGSEEAPYYMPDCNQMPQRLAVTDPMKDAYYRTGHWQNLGQRRLERDCHRCVICGSTDEPQVHHICYQLFSEDIDHLMTVCRLHHEMIHDTSRLKFPSGVSIEHANQLGVAWEIADWLLPAFSLTNF